MKHPATRLGICLIALFVLPFPANAREPISANAAQSPQFLKVPSQSMHRDVAVTVALPKDYAASSARYPVVFLLHGATDNEKTWYERGPVQQMADAHHFIIVMPDGAMSWYFDSPVDESFRHETFISKELVPFIDSRYRTIPRREARALTGHSMGGHGSMFLAIRHKDIFSAAAPMSGGMDIRASDPKVGAFPDKWELSDRLGPIRQHPERWDAHTVINLIDSLKPGELALSICCGTEDFFLTVNRALHAKLEGKGIPHAYFEGPGGHEWDYWRANLPRQMDFLDAHFKKTGGR